MRRSKKIYFPKSLKSIAASFIKTSTPQIYIYKDTKIINTPYYDKFKYYDTLEDLINQNKTFKEANSLLLEELKK